MMVGSLHGQGARCGGRLISCWTCRMIGLVFLLWDISYLRTCWCFLSFSERNSLISCLGECLAALIFGVFQELNEDGTDSAGVFLFSNLLAFSVLPHFCPQVHVFPYFYFFSPVSQATNLVVILPPTSGVILNLFFLYLPHLNH